MPVGIGGGADLRRNARPMPSRVRQARRVDLGARVPSCAARTDSRCVARPHFLTGNRHDRLSQTKSEFVVRHAASAGVDEEAGEPILTGGQWRAENAPAVTPVPWNRPRPPSALAVAWSSPEGGERRSWWIVNVTDGSRLPPPEELRDLPLQVLLEILSSARPLHEALARAKHQSGAAGPTLRDLDPLRRVDTSQYLLKRVKRVSTALEGLGVRLGRPAFSLDALRWRLEGPVGPLALARRLCQEEPRAAAFGAGA